MFTCSLQAIAKMVTPLCVGRNRKCPESGSLDEWWVAWACSLTCHHCDKQPAFQGGRHREDKWLRCFSNKLHLPLWWAQPPCTLYSFFALPSAPLSPSLFFVSVYWISIMSPTWVSMGNTATNQVDMLWWNPLCTFLGIFLVFLILKNALHIMSPS